jgi:hypothetical protein
VEDRGGRIETYVDRYQGVRSSGEIVIIDGFCASACAIVLGISRRLGSRFQRSQDNQSRRTQTLYSIYPFEVRRWIDQRGGLTPHMIFLSGRELAGMYRPCFVNSQASSH